MVDHTHVYDNICDADCNECGVTRIPSPHAYSGTCDKDCNVCYYVREAGEHTYETECDTTCDVCGFMRETIHTYTNVCDTSCDVCGEYRVAEHYFETPCDELCKYCAFKRETEHSYFNACDPICDLCGYERDIPGHQYDNDEDLICNNCGVSRGENHKHVYPYPCSEKCENCNGERVPDEPHKYDNEMDMECNYCGYSRLSSHEHVYSNTCDDKCKVCNAERSVTHTYDSPEDSICNICNYQRITDHECVYASQCHKLCLICYKETGEGHRFVNKVCSKCGEYDKCPNGGCVFTNECDEICDTCGYRRGYVNHNFVNGYCTKCGTKGYESHVHEYDSVCDETCNICGYIRGAHIWEAECDESCNFCGHTRVGIAEHVDNNNDKLCDNCKQILSVAGDDVNARLNNFIGIFNLYLTGIEQGSPIAKFENTAFTNVKISGNAAAGVDYYKSFEMYDDFVVYKYDDYDVYKKFGEISYTLEKFHETGILDANVYFNYTITLPKITIYDLSYNTSTNTVSIKADYLFKLFTALENSNWDPNIVIGNSFSVNFDNLTYLMMAADSATCDVKLSDSGDIVWYKVELMDNGNSILLNEYSIDGKNVEIKFNKDGYNGRITSTFSIKNSKLNYTLTNINNGSKDTTTVTANVSTVSRNNIPTEVFNAIEMRNLLIESLKDELATYKTLYEVDSTCEFIYVKMNSGNLYALFARDYSGKYYLSQLISEFALQEFMCQGKIVNGTLIVSKHNH